MLSGIPIKFIVYAAVVAVLLGGFIAWNKYQQSIGGEAERASQEKANARFRVLAAKGAVDYDTCDKADGLYDFAKGACKLP